MATTPNLQKGWQRAERLADVRIVATRLGNGRAQLGVAERAHRGQHTAQDPDHQRQANGASFLEYAPRRDEDATAHDDAHYDGNAVDQAQLFLECHRAWSNSIAFGFGLLF